MNLPKLDPVCVCRACGLVASHSMDYEGVDIQTVSGAHLAIEEWILRTCARCGYTWKQACYS